MIINNMSFGSPKKNQYRFCYSEKNPLSLVILKQPTEIPSLILKNIGPPLLIAIEHESDDGYASNLDTVEMQLSQTIIARLSNIAKAQSYLQQSGLENVLIICHIEHYQQSVALRQKHKSIKNIFCIVNQVNDELIELGIEFLTDSIQELLSWIQYFKNLKTDQKILPNFLFTTSQLKNDVGDSNKLSIILKAMLVQDIDQNSSIMILDQLEKVVQQIQKLDQYYSINSEQTRKFLAQLRKGFSPEDSIRWYTKQSIINRLVNNLLRSARDPLQIFYIQPYFKNLFNSIQQIQQRQHFDQTFVCYRGGKITDEEAELFMQNQGKIIQSLGFLSTSLNYSIAESFEENVMYEIIVQNPKFQKQCQWNKGFAEVSQFSDYSDEKQIIFNPLNYFKVSFAGKKQKSKKYLIRLVFGDLEAIYNSPYGSLSDDQKLVKILFEIQRKQDRKIKLQGDVTLWAKQAFQVLDGSEQYYQKLLQITQLNLALKPNQNNLLRIKCYVLNSIGMFKMKRGFFLESLRYYEQCEKLTLQVRGPNDPDYLQALNALAVALSRNWKIESSIQLHEICLVKRRQILGCEHIDYLISICNLIALYLKTKRYEQVLLIERHIKSLDIFREQNSYPYFEIVYLFAKCYYMMLEYEKVESICMRNIEISKKIFGQNHVYYIQLIQILIQMYYRLKQFNRCLEWTNKLIRDREKALHGHCPRLIKSITIIERVYNKLNKWEQLKDLQKFCIQVHQRIIENNNNIPYLEILLLGRVYLNLNNYDMSMQIFNKYLPIALQLYGPENEQYLEYLKDLGQLFEKTGKMMEAAKVFMRYLDVYENKKSSSIPDSYMLVFYRLCQIYKKKKLSQMPLLNSYKKLLNVNIHPYEVKNLYLDSLLKIGMIYNSEGRYIEEFKVIKKSLKLRKKFFIMNCQEYENCLKNMCCTLKNIQNFRYLIYRGQQYLKHIRWSLKSRFRVQIVELLLGGYISRKQYAPAFSLSSELIQNQQNSSEQERKHYLPILFIFFTYSLQMKDRIHEAIAASLKSLKWFVTQQKQSETNFFLVLHKLAFLYQQMGLLTKCLKALRISREIQQRYPHQKNEFRAFTLSYTRYIKANRGKILLKNKLSDLSKEYYFQIQQRLISQSDTKNGTQQLLAFLLVLVCNSFRLRQKILSIGNQLLQYNKNIFVSSAKRVFKRISNQKNIIQCNKKNLRSLDRLCMINC